MSAGNERSDRADDTAFGELLRAAGRRPQPSVEQLARWRHHFEAELGAARRQRRVVRAAALIGACAAAVLAAVILLPSQVAEAPAPPVAEVTGAFGGIVVRGDDGAVTPLRRADHIRAGDQVEAGLHSGLGVRYRHADVRLDAATTVIFGSESLRLVSGRLYADTGASPAGPALRVETPLGSFEHVGTQFLVSVAEDEVRGAVREGRIVLRQAMRDVPLAAATGAAQMVVVSRAGAVRETPVAATGELWAWTEATSPGITVAGRSAADVLQWVARERGMRLTYQNAAARHQAQRAQLAGSGGRLAPERALAVAAAAARLRVAADTAGAKLTVSLAPDGHPPVGAPSEGDQDTH